MCKNSLSSSSFMYLKQKNSSNCCLGRGWQWFCNRFSRFLLDLDGWGCHLDSISSTEISHWPLWAAFGAYCQVWRKEWGCSDLHLSFRGQQRILWGNLCGCCWPIHSQGTTGIPHLSTSLKIEVKSVSTKNIPLVHIPGAKQGGLFSWAKLDSPGLVLTLCKSTKHPPSPLQAGQQCVGETPY